MDLNKLFYGMGVLIAIYLLGRFGPAFDQLLSSTYRFVEHQTATLQGNYPFQVVTPRVQPRTLTDYIGGLYPFGSAGGY